MAHFRAVIQGSRGQASRLGNTVIEASINGWHSGVNVEGGRSGIDAIGDIFEISITGGSNASSSQKEIVRFSKGQLVFTDPRTGKEICEIDLNGKGPLPASQIARALSIKGGS